MAHAVRVCSVHPKVSVHFILTETLSHFGVSTIIYSLVWHMQYVCVVFINVYTSYL